MRLLVKQAHHSSQLVVLTSLRCLLVSVQVVYVIYLKMLRKMHHVLFSSMKLMQWVVSVALVLVADTMNVNKRLTNY
ncbi:Uncharacterised protein [Mycobacteroides abscessus]|nr:Uncharacterised protein [Mycobacteroides abscessus]